MAIYEISGNRLKICYAQPFRERPKEFCSKVGSTDVCLILERCEELSGP